MKKHQRVEKIRPKQKLYGKIVKFLLILFILMFLIAFSNGKTWAGVVAFL